MSIFKNKKSLIKICITLLLFKSFPVMAQWPTLDITAIKEGIQSKVELVKQSSVITEATQFGGKLNSAIGDATGSISKFAGDNIEKAKKQAEKLEREKERLEKKKKKLEERKEKLEKHKEKLEKVKKMKAEAEKKMAEAKKMKEQAQKKIAEGKSAINDAKETVNEVSSTVNEVKATVNDAKATAKGAVRDHLPAKQENPQLETEDNFVDDYVEQYENGINSDAKMYEPTLGSEMPESNALTDEALAEGAMQEEGLTESAEGVIPEEGQAENEPQLPMNQIEADNLEKAQLQSLVNPSLRLGAGPMGRQAFKRDLQLKASPKQGKSKIVSQSPTLAQRPLGTKSQTASSLQGQQGKKLSISPQLTKAPNHLSEKVKNLNIAPQRNSQPKEIKTLNNLKNSMMNKPQGFRQRPQINLNNKLKLPNQSFMWKVLEQKKIVGFKRTDSVVLGAMDLENFPDGTIDNGEYEETILTEAMVEYCEVGVQDVKDTKAVQECLKKIIRHASDENNQVADEGKALIVKMQTQQILADLADVTRAKVVVANGNAEIEKQEELLSNASNTRDDSSAQAMAIMREQKLLNDITRILSASLAQNALGLTGGISKEFIEEEGDE